MGGGGFWVEPDNPLLDAYVARLAGSERPRVCFLPTASGDAQSAVYRFHRHFKRLTGKRSSHLTLTPPSKPDLAAHLLSQEVIYVGGGNTATLLRVWRETGVDRILREAYERGIVLAGVSAGAVCWFEQGLTDAVAGTLTPLPALGFLKGSACPHVDSEPERRPTFRRLIGAGVMPAGYGLEDGVAAHFVDGEFHRCVSSRPDARAYYVEKRDDGLRETELLPLYLGGAGTLIRRAVGADVPGIIAAHRRSIQEIASRDYNESQVAAWSTEVASNQSEAKLTAQLATDCVWVIEADGSVEGFVHLRMPADAAPAAYLHALYVTPAVAGRGLAKRLMALAEREASRRGHPRIELHSSKTALGFYGAVGYQRSGEPLLHSLNGVGISCFPMTKSLVAPPAGEDAGREI
jgi:peptidase E/GNAT superfamily N-acetyltransferase